MLPTSSLFLHREAVSFNGLYVALVIKAKQAAIAKLQAELDEARAVLAAYLDGMMQTYRVIGSVRRRRPGRKRTRTRLEQSPTAHAAATIIRATGRPLHVTAILKAMKRKGHTVSPGTLVSALAPWVRSRAVFYRASPNVFGLVEMWRKQRR